MSKHQVAIYEQLELMLNAGKDISEIRALLGKAAKYALNRRDWDYEGDLVPARDRFGLLDEHEEVADVYRGFRFANSHLLRNQATLETGHLRNLLNDSKGVLLAKHCSRRTRKKYINGCARESVIALRRLSSAPERRGDANRQFSKGIKYAFACIVKSFLDK